jgi:hypothetical protein
VTTGRPDPEPLAPLPDAYLPRRRPRPGILLVIAVAGVLLLAGFGFAVNSLFDSGDPKAAPGKGGVPPSRSPVAPTPSASASPPAARPGFTAIVDVCGLFPKSTMARLVGTAKDEEDSISSTWRCSRHRDQDVADRSVIRDAALDITLSPADDGEAATRDFAGRREDARTGRTWTVTGSEFGPMKDLHGIGDEAYYQYQSDSAEKAIFNSGTGVVVTRVRNAVVAIEYGGYATSSGLKSKRMADATARDGAIEITRGVVKALTGCTACRG